jgi:hypothetical protein
MRSIGLVACALRVIQSLQVSPPLNHAILSLRLPPTQQENTLRMIALEFKSVVLAQQLLSVILILQQ